ncbi:hypothetical protein J2Z48_000258 [Croceifilum oryzae]|uniref:Peptidoglycan binding-like domain-containing protein n=1 Tax=Croceifilum oryzae TaxID=1553429 RepID=A0AAJ1TK88_9BACL|nr:peptidoglycan-binding domain-containing protein [Croceifilum oryzae]MDQ0416100.1 hypothetical protein [Croceifilum oryzae]
MKSRVKRLVPILFIVLIVMVPITAFSHPMQDVWSKNDYVGSGYISSGGYVQAVQRMLLETPWGYSRVDGRYGKNTKKGIAEFQENRKIRADGIVGSDTWSRFQAYRSYVGAKGSAHLYQFTFNVQDNSPAMYRRDACYGWFVDIETTNKAFEYWKVDHGFERQHFICM